MKRIFSVAHSGGFHVALCSYVWNSLFCNNSKYNLKCAISDVPSKNSSCSGDVGYISFFPRCPSDPSIQWVLELTFSNGIGSFPHSYKYHWLLLYSASLPVFKLATNSQFVWRYGEYCQFPFRCDSAVLKGKRWIWCVYMCQRYNCF